MQIKSDSHPKQEDNPMLLAQKGAEVTVASILGPLLPSLQPILESSSTSSTSKLIDVGETLGSVVRQSGLVETGKSTLSFCIDWLLTVDSRTFVNPILAVVELCLLFVLAFLRGYHDISTSLQLSASIPSAIGENTDTIQNTCQWVHIRVGGVSFQTTISTLARYPDSLLYNQVSNLRHLKNQTLIFDRDPVPFRFILNHLRGQDIAMYNLSEENSVFLKQIIIECEFYGLQSVAEALST